MVNAQLHGVLHYLESLGDAQALTEASDAELLEWFARGHEETPFAALVRRHGPMVWSVARRVLPHLHDAEDVFQATFLLLARKATSIRKAASVGSWLHGVAHRLALKARLQQARRQTREKRAADMRSTRTSGETSLSEVLAALDGALGELPEKYRAALVLCYLEGQTQEEAARRLGCPLATVRTRVARGRKLLRDWLAKHGLTLSTAGLAALLISSAAPAAAPAVLVKTAIRAALAFAAGQSAAALCTEQAAGLVKGGLQAMILTKVKTVTLLLLAVSLIATGAGVLAHRAVAAREQPVASPTAEAPTQKPEPVAAKPPATPEKSDQVTVSGRVVDSDSKPVAGAKLFLCDRSGKSAAPQSATDRDGRFRFALAALADLGPRYLLATGNGLGLDWADLRLLGAGQELTLRLPADVPIRGKVMDLEGKPIAGATVRLVELSTTASGNLDEFLKQWAADKEKSPTGPAFHLLTEKRLWLPKVLRQLATATTGPDGAFRLSEIGRDRGLMLGIRGPGIADQYVRVVTRPDFAARPVSRGQVALAGPEPAVVVAPSKPIMGTLRDAQTKEPLAGVRVLGYTPDRPIDWWWQPVEAVTDAQGRYRLDGLAKTARQIVTFDPGAGAPHMHRFDEVGDTEGFVPIVHDSELRRGIVVSGQVTDRSTGRPVRARVVYCPLLNNEYFDRTRGYDKPHTQLTLWVDSREMISGADGRYRLTGLPGPGALFVRAVGRAGQFTQPSVPKKDQDPQIYDAQGEVFMTRGLGDIFPMSDLHAYRLIRPAADAAEVTADFTLDPGVRRRGRLLDPDGRPLAGAEAVNLRPPSVWKTVLPGAEFTAEALNPAKQRRLLFWHHERKLAGTMVLRGNEPEPVTVTLQPLAALTGRAVRKNGEPLAGYAVEYGAWPELEWPGNNKGFQREPILTDKDGRFRLPDLPAGVPLNLLILVPKTRYAFIHRDKVVLEPGKTRNLGNLQGEPKEP
jgi:RNA polymerase sigma factor (sigma-70 family)